MGLEGQDAERRPQLLRQAQRLSEQGPVAQVHTVEVADRHDGAARLGRQIIGMPENRHASRAFPRLATSSWPGRKLARSPLPG
jgi:hypothetical protein